jgi:hypothetical protein
MLSSASSRGTRLSLCVLVAAGIAGAQVYPGGGGSPYPGGRSPYPGSGGGLPFPLPGKRGQDKQSKDPAQPLPSFRGALKRFDDKALAIELGDNRVLDFRRTGKTRFFKAGEEIKSPKFALGDEVSVEAIDEPGGYLTAVNVHWEKGAGAATDTAKRSPERDKAEGTPDAWAKDDPDRPVLRRTSPPAEAPKEDPDRPVLRRGGPPAEAGPAAEAPKEEAAGPSRPVASAEKAPPTARSDDDEGRPVLRRGGQSGQRAPAPARPVEVAEAKAPAAPVFRDGEDHNSIPVVTRGSGDDTIRKAADAALDFTETLPAYVCQEIMTRYQGEGKPVRWQALDVVTMNLVFENGKEDYRDIKVNGKPKQSLDETGGAWSTGEFGTVLIDLFSPATATDFVYRRQTSLSGITTKVYDFSVARENSHWSIKMGSQGYNPPYKGSVWIDPKTSRVMRIEMQAYGFPASFPADHVESATDYQYIRLGDTKQYLLPVHAETLTCHRGTDVCSRNTIDFRNYRKYSGESTITFEVPKEK